MQDLVPDNVYLNGLPCKVYFDTRVAQAIPGIRPTADELLDQTIRNSTGRIRKEDMLPMYPWGPPSAAAQALGTQAISINNGVLYGVDGNPVILKVSSAELYFWTQYHDLMDMHQTCNLALQHAH